MRKMLLAAAGFAALASAAGLALAQEDPAPRGIFQMDANSDGALTRAEFDAGRAAAFTRLDADGDGQLTREEMRAGHRERRDRDGEHHGRRGHGRGAMHLMGADANSDGNITRDEFLARPNEMFDRLDADRNGVITEAERPRRRERADGERRGDRPNPDADGDGQFSQAEWTAMGAHIFQRLDANSDGSVTREEARAAHGRRGERHGDRH